jgi:hypothetical protein
LDQRYVEWLHPGGTVVPQDPQPFETNNNEDDNTDFFHGTKVLSRAVGGPLGIGRQTAVTIVRLPRSISTHEELLNDVYPTFRTSCLSHAFELIYRDILAKMSQGGDHADVNFRSVINISVGNVFKYDATDDILEEGHIPVSYEDPTFTTYLWMEQLLRLGVVITAAAGNDADQTKPNSLRMRVYPAIWSSSASALQTSSDFPLIVS